MNLYSCYEQQQQQQQQESHDHLFSSTDQPTDNTIHHIIQEAMEEPKSKRLCTHNNYLPEHDSRELHHQKQEQEGVILQVQGSESKQLSPFSSRFIAIQDNLDFLDKLTRDMAEHNRRREQAKRRLQFGPNI